jgi:uncharacterized protein YjiK
MISENIIHRTDKINKSKITLTVALFSLWVSVIFLISGYLSSALAEPDKGFIRKIRALDLEFLDISNPAGLAYSPGDKQLFVVEDTQTSVRAAQNKTLVKAISLTEEKLSSKELPIAASSPGNITFDQESKTLLVSEPGKNRLVQVKTQPNGQLAAPTSSVDVNRSAVPKNIRGMTSDPLTGRVFFLDSGNNEIVSTNSAGTLVTRIDLQEIGQTNLTAIAFNPVNKHFYVLNPATQKLFEVSEDGTVENVIDVSEFNLKNPQSMVFAPSGDQTDDPSIMHLYIADSGNQRSSLPIQRAGTSFLTQNIQATDNSGQILELSFTPAANALASSCVATLVQETLLSQLIPPSPDSSGITYEATSGLLVISDGEVEELPALFTGENIFETDLSGNLVSTATTIPFNSTPSGRFNSEPTGVTIDPVTGHFFFSDDDSQRVDVVMRSSTPSFDFDLIRRFLTSDFGSTDPEGITFADLGAGQQALFIADGLGREIYRLDPGVNGVFDGIPPTGDDSVSNFDTTSMGLLDPEGIVYNDNGFLYITGNDNTVITEFKLSGSVVRTCDISAAAGIKPAGLAMAPGSQNSSVMNLYIVDRGADNTADPGENDGRLFEMSIPALINLAPTANAGSDQTIILPATANLGGSHTDDGLPDPPFLITSTWSQQSGPATATIVNPNTEDTEVNFPVEGTYVFRLTADDSQLSDFDDVTITVLPAGTQTSTISLPISLGSDDAEEQVAGNVILGSVDLDLVRSGGNQIVGLRFNGITIPQNTIIVDAYIQFTAQGIHSETTSLTLEGQATDNAVTFVNNINGNVSTRPRTTASVSWLPTPWTTVGEAGLEQRTSDLTSVVQEIVNRSGWVSNNSLALIITGSGKRDADAFEANPLAAPMLHVEFVDASANQPPTALISAPADGASFTVGDNITFTGTGTDPEDGDVTASLTWDSNLDGTIGTGGSFSTTLSEGTHTITATATDSGSLTGLDTITISVLPPGGGTTTIAIPINSGSDDAEEKPAGNVIIGSIDLDLVASGGNQTIGMRFNNVTIPQGTTIVNAFIQFMASGTQSTATSLTLEGEAADNALTFVNNINGNVSTRPKTNASVLWSPVAWTIVGEAGVNQRTPDLTAIVQEIVNRSNWASNNSLAMIVTGSGKREADAFEANPSTAPVLHVEFGDATGNQPPAASISAPANGSSFTVGNNITFTGTGTDPEDGDVTASLAWDSNLDGAIGTGGSFSITTLSEGTHTITATATDSGSLTGLDTTMVTISAAGNTPPTALISAPADGASFTVGDNITFTGTGTDPEDGDVTAGLTWDSNLDGAIGTGGSFSTTLSEGTHTITVTATDSGSMTGLDTITISVLPPGGGTTTIAIPINSGSDDAEEKPAGNVIIGSIDLDLVASGGNQTIGMRFNNVTIPQGTTIVNAYIQFTASGTQSTATSLTLEGEAADNAITFVNNINGNVSTRPRTNASVPWSPVAWTTVGEAGVKQRTPDLTAIVQEIVNQNNWASNNSLAIIVTGSGKRDADAFEANPSTAPVLHVEFADATGNQSPTALISAPTGGASFTVGDNITFTGTGTDPEDGDVTASLTWDSNLDGAIGTGGSFSITTLSEGTHTITATATDSDSLTGLDTITISVLPPGGGTTTIAIPVNSGSDDAEEKPAGNVIIGSIDLDLVASGGNQTIGMRFNNVTIPQGTTIVNAYIQFTASGTQSTATSLTLEGEAADNAITFVNNINGNVSTRPRTIASVPWSPAAWTTVGDAGVDQQTPDLTTIVQEIVDRSNWASNNSLAIIVTGSGKRDADAFEANASAAPILHVEFMQ